MTHVGFLLWHSLETLRHCPETCRPGPREATAIWRAIQSSDAGFAERCCVDQIKAAAVAALEMIERTSVEENQFLSAR